MKRISGIILTVCMLLSILPANVFATNITIFNVTVNEPKTGENLSYEASVPETASTYVTKVEWTGELDASGTVTYGKYEVRITVRIKDGMDDKYIKVPSKDTVKVNGKSAKLKEVTDDKKQAVVVYTFNIEDTRTEHMHCYCGGYIENTGDHTSHKEVTYKKWTGESAVNYTNKVAYIYLDQDVGLDSTLNIGGGKTLYLCLNGHALSMKYRGQRVINVSTGGQLYLCNCTRSEGGQITKGEAEYGAGIHNNGTVRMFGGVITKNNGGYGGGVYNNVNFYMYGGDIYNNKANYGGGLWNDNDSSSTFTMYNGTITLNVASSGAGVWNNDGATLVLKGGDLTQNAAANGGAVWNNGGLVELDGAQILDNCAKHGGGVWNNGGNLYIKSGSIAKNMATTDPERINGYGGGIWNNGGYVNMTGGQITFNRACFGGGVWVNEGSEFLMSGGVVAENEAYDGAGIYNNGTVRLSDKAGVLMNYGSGNGSGVYLKGKLYIEGEAEVIGNYGQVPDTVDIYKDGGDVYNNVSLPTQFVDVKPDDYFVDAVKWAVENNITSGTTEFTFSPNDKCNLGEILTFLWRAAGSPQVKTSPLIADVYPDDYYYMAAYWAQSLGIFNTALYPWTSCSRLNSVWFMWYAAGKPEVKRILPFTDVEEPSPSVAWALEEGITSGSTPTTFDPHKTCTRAQIITFLYRAYGNK